MSETKKWFRLENINVNYDKFNNMEDLKKKLSKARKVNKDTYYLTYIKIRADLVFNGKLNTPSGEVDTDFNYVIETNLDDLLKEAKITVLEQTFNGLSEAVTIRFSSGSIISKIVFGDIEKAFIELKNSVLESAKIYNQEIEKFNKEIEVLVEKQEANGNEED